MRKNEKLTYHPDQERLGEIFRYIGEHPHDKHAQNVSRVLELISGLTASEPMTAFTRLNSALRGYQWTIRVARTSEGFRPIILSANREKLSRTERWEMEAIRDLLNVVPYLGKKSRIRRCAECKDWFVTASLRDRKFCSGSCKQYRYDSDPEIRERKRRYMQENRATHKRLNEIRKETVGFLKSVKRPSKYT